MVKCYALACTSSYANKVGVLFKFAKDAKRTFFIPLPDRSADTLRNIIHTWIELGTTIISDCWGAYRRLGDDGYRLETVNHSVCFVDPWTGAHMNTTEATWRHVKVFLNPYNWKANYLLCLAEYMFASLCRTHSTDPFTTFLHVVRSVDWANRPARIAVDEPPPLQRPLMPT